MVKYLTIGKTLQSTVLMLFITALVMFATELASFAGERLYTFDTDDAWELYEGDWNKATWKVEGGELNFAGGSSDASIIVMKESEGIKSHDGMAIEVDCFDVAEGAWQNFGVVWSCLDEEGSAHSAMGLIQSEATRLEKVSLTTGARSTVLNMGSQYSPRRWYTMKLEIKDGVLTVFTAEKDQELEERATHTINDADLGGRIGFAVSNSVSNFDNLKVSGPEIQGKIAVKPASKLPATWAAIKSSY
ncbi:hypothetical protein ACFL6S_05165 [Candidatus Poribacteria bacterium]